MSSGGGSAPTQQNVTSTTSNLPEYAQPYFMNLMNRAQAQSYEKYTPYGGQQVAGFNPAQQQVQGETMGLQTPGQFGGATQLAGAAGLGALQAGQYNPNQFQTQQISGPQLQQYSLATPERVQAQQQVAGMMGAPQMVQGGQGVAAQMNAAQTGFDPKLQNFNVNAPQAFGMDQAQQYMSPYTQNVLDVQKSEAIRDAQKGQLAQDLGAARQGTYGGARQLLAATERERNLGSQLGQIQASGLQAAYANAQQQFGADRAAQMQAQLANQQAGLGVQQLGTQIGAQTALANLSSEQQANVQNLAAQLQTQGLNQQQAMQAALANQQMGFNTSQQNLNAYQQTQSQNAQQALQAALANQQAGLTTGQANLGAAQQTQQLGAQTGVQALMANQASALQAQQMAEQSGQFGANLGLQGLSQAQQAASNLGNLGTQAQQADLARLNAQNAVGNQLQQLQQQYNTTAYNNFLAQRDWQTSQLGYFSNMLRGTPVTPNTITSSTSPAPSPFAQLAGAGLGTASLFNLARG